MQRSVERGQGACHQDVLAIVALFDVLAIAAQLEDRDVVGQLVHEVNLVEKYPEYHEVEGGQRAVQVALLNTAQLHRILILVVTAQETKNAHRYDIFNYYYKIFNERYSKLAHLKLFWKWKYI